VNNANVGTKEQTGEIRKHYREQGVTYAEMLPGDEAIVVPTNTQRVGVTWRLWRAGPGVIADCDICHQSMAFEVKDRADRKAIRFAHCKRVDRLPWLLRWFPSLLEANVPAPRARRILVGID